MLRRSARRDARSAEQIREHYHLERELAARLRTASPEDRRRLYSDVYDELYARVSHHPRLARRPRPEETRAHVASQLRFLLRFCKRASTFAEIGPGDCALSFEMCRHMKRVYGVDVAEQTLKGAAVPRNFRWLLSDGSSIPLPEQSVDLVYSHQLMEHLHPDDAAQQLADVYRCLSPGGRYVCVTPNRLNGPHDISRDFDEIPTGFHLKEYTATELVGMFRKVGFRRTEVYLGAKGVFLPAPVGAIMGLEALLSRLPRALQRRVARSYLLRPLLAIRLVATKAG